jgi:phosphatidylglycerophosphate synthase
MEAAEPLNTISAARADLVSGCAVEESRRDAHYPISRWYLRPLAGHLAAVLADTPVRPNWLSAAGLLAASAGAALLVCRPELQIAAALLVLLAWFFDRADGRLARLQGTASRLGAWIDANVDELVDLGLHVAVAAAASAQQQASWPWAILTAFLVGKYLFMYGLSVEEGLARRHAVTDAPASNSRGWLASVYHLPGNADVRIHLLALAVATGWLVPELALVAVYYNFRWIVRYALVSRRWGGLR